MFDQYLGERDDGRAMIACHAPDFMRRDMIEKE